MSKVDAVILGVGGAVGAIIAWNAYHWLVPKVVEKSRAKVYSSTQLKKRLQQYDFEKEVLSSWSILMDRKSITK